MAKILLIPEFSSYGGTFTYFKDIVSFYYSLKYEVVVVLKKEQLNQEVNELIGKYKYKYFILPEVKKIFKKLKPKFLFDSIFVFFNLLPFYSKFKPDIAVVSTGTPGNLLSLIFLSSRFLYVLHTYPSKSRIPSESRINFLIKIFLKLNLSKRKRILTVSEYSKKEIIKLWGLFKKEIWINVIYNTISIKEKSEKTFRVEEIRNNEKIKILTVGHLRWYKNPLLWIEVAEIVNKSIHNKNVEFIWSGDGELLTKCNKLIKTLNLDNVSFAGYQKDIENIISSCDIYFQPSTVESFGLCVLDAMRLKKPCVVSNAGGLPEIVDDNKTGFIINLNDIEKMAERIILLINDKDLRLEMGKAGSDRYINCFSYKIWQDKMIKLYDSLLRT
ncbi:MAG: glycosyltransferase family 4 protein [Candidatus Humimicrobiaceae bacterium]